MSSQSHVSLCRVGLLPLDEFTGSICHFAGCKNSIRHIENRFSSYFIFCFLVAAWVLTSGGFRIVSDTLVYPALQTPPQGLNFADQFAFRPTGSTVAALITLLHTVFTMLDTQPFVRVFALDFSKAFDTVSTQSSWKRRPV